MRKSFNNFRVIKDENTIYGISLGYDFCAEHEWGNEKMRSKFGIDIDKMGVDARTNSKGEVYIFENKTHILLTSENPYQWRTTPENPKFEDAVPYEGFSKDSEITTFWDGGDFCVILKKTKENVQIIHDLEQAVKDKELVIGYLKSGIEAFSNSSLSLTIKSRLPKEIIEQMYKVDKERVDLIEYEEKIGVTELKRNTRGNGYKGEKYFCACSPRWINYDDPKEREKRKKEMGTKYDIQFWVNYSDDDDNFGWYRAEDIIKWLSTPGLKLKSLNK